MFKNKGGLRGGFEELDHFLAHFEINFGSALLSDGILREFFTQLSAILLLFQDSSEDGRLGPILICAEWHGVPRIEDV